MPSLWGNFFDTGFAEQCFSNRPAAHEAACRHVQYSFNIFRQPATSNMGSYQVPLYLHFYQDIACDITLSNLTDKLRCLLLTNKGLTLILIGVVEDYLHCTAEPSQLFNCPLCDILVLIGFHTWNQSSLCHVLWLEDCKMDFPEPTLGDCSGWVIPPFSWQALLWCLWARHVLPLRSCSAGVLWSSQVCYFANLKDTFLKLYFNIS